MITELCIECAHCRRVAFWDGRANTTAHLCARRHPDIRDPVEGTTSADTRAPFCKSQRKRAGWLTNRDQQCGPEAKFFQKKS